MRTLLFIVAVITARVACAQDLQYRWLYSSHNLLVEENLAALQGIMRRARDAGYNGVVISDYKLQILDQVPERYARNIERLKVEAAHLGLHLYPTVFQVGYASGLLSHDPNLIEGQPVRDALFIVGDGAATLVPDPAVRIENGGLEGQTDKQPGFALQDGPGKTTFSDTAIFRSGRAALRMESFAENAAGNGRLAQTVTVAPWRQYRLSAWIKTEGFERAGNVRIQALTPDSGRQLSTVDLGVRPTQEWKLHQVVFNSQDHTSAIVYFGVWGGRGGRIWWDDCTIEEVGLLNVIRRPGAPLVVLREGGEELQEGRDFEAVGDPKLGLVPYAGNYGIGHAPPAIRFTPGSPIRRGDRLRVSFYHAAITDYGKPALCMSEPAAYDLLRTEAENVYKLFRPKGLFMAHDEVRVMNWCAACQGRGLTPGQLLAENTSRCADIIRTLGGPDGAAPRVFVWSDMFDPAHNAVRRYYLCNGSAEGAVAGLDPSTVVVNWNFEKRARSLPFFAERGHQQILAGYYDKEPEAIRTWLDDSRALNVPIAGVMYTTWHGNYDDLEAFARAAWGP